jgi:hypothetical protein
MSGSGAVGVAENTKTGIPMAAAALMASQVPEWGIADDAGNANRVWVWWTMRKVRLRNASLVLLLAWKTVSGRPRYSDRMR